MEVIKIKRKSTKVLDSTFSFAAYSSWFVHFAPQLRPAVQQKTETSLSTAPQVMSATSSTRETLKLVSQTEASASSRGPTLVWQTTLFLFFITTFYSHCFLFGCSFCEIGFLSFSSFLFQMLAVWDTSTSRTTKTTWVKALKIKINKKCDPKKRCFCQKMTFSVLHRFQLHQCCRLWKTSQQTSGLKCVSTVIFFFNHKAFFLGSSHMNMFNKASDIKSFWFDLLRPEPRPDLTCFFLKTSHHVVFFAKSHDKLEAKLTSSYIIQPN